MDCNRAHQKPRRMAGDVPGFFAAADGTAQRTDSHLGAEPAGFGEVEQSLFLRAQAGGRARRVPTACGDDLLSRHGTARSRETFFCGGEGNTNIRSIRTTPRNGLNLPALRALLHAAVELDADVMVPPAPKVKRPPRPVLAFFKQALAGKCHRAAAENFRALSPSCQREYLVWLTMAKRPATRARPLQETLAALTSGRKWAQRKPA